MLGAKRRDKAGSQALRTPLTLISKGEKARSKGEEEHRKGAGRRKHTRDTRSIMVLVRDAMRGNKQCKQKRILVNFQMKKSRADLT